MHTPTKAQMQVVIDNLKKVLPQAMHEGALDMGESAVNKRRHTCGTTHCFAGWYAIAALNTNHLLDFTDGKEAINKDLGFDFTDGLASWASRNPKLWGNYNAYGVFTNKNAFSHIIKRPFGAQNLQHIIDHLKEVRDRLPV